MGTRTLAFAYFVLILQVVSGVFSAFPDGPQIRRRIDANNDLKGAPFKDDIQAKDSKIRGDLPNLDYNQLDDVYENQIPPPPVQESLSADTNYEDEMFENAIRGISEDSTPVDSNVLSGAGHLETNEIVKDPTALIRENSESTSKSNNDESKVEADKGSAPVATKQYNYPELDKAVENAVNNLPPSEESPLVPLIKIFKDRVQNQLNDENGNQEDMERKIFLKKHIILKLANKVRSDNEENESHTENVISNESKVQQQQEKESNQAQNSNEDSEENPPCACEDGCEGETSQGQTELEQTPVSDQNRNEYEEEHTNNNRNPKILAHVIVMLRKPKPEETNGPKSLPQARFSNPREEFIPFRPRESSPLAEMFLRVASKSTLTNTFPSFPTEDNENVGSREEISRQEYVSPTSPISLRIYRKRLITGMALKGRDHKDESSQEDGQATFSRFSTNENDQNTNIPDIKRFQYGQPIPKEFLLLKHIIDIMKAKAAANALRESQERQIPQFFSSPSFAESPSVPSTPIPRLIIIRPKNQQPQPELPPLNFPDENSGYQIRHMDDVFPNFGQLNQDDSASDSELSPPAQILNHIQEVTQSQGSRQLLTQNSPQDLPWFIKNILANISRPVGQAHFQPIPSQYSPVQKPAEERNPVLFRAVLAPYAL